MSISTKSDTGSVLCCELCDYIQFSSYAEFHVHHLSHVRQPLVSLVKINSKLHEKLNKRSYTIKTGVARRTVTFAHVPPLKISVVNEQGLKQFQVVKKVNYTGQNSQNLDCFSDTDSENRGVDNDKRNSFRGSTSLSEVEGKNLLERFGATDSVCLKSKAPSQNLTKPVLEYYDNVDENGRKETDNSQRTTDGTSVRNKSKYSPNSNPEPKSPSLVFTSKLQNVDLKELKKLKDQDGKNDQKLFDTNKVLKRVSDSGLISIASKSPNKRELEKPIPSDKFPEKKGKKSIKSEIFDKSISKVITKNTLSQSEDNNHGAELQKISEGLTCKVNCSDYDNGKVVVTKNESENAKKKRFTRVKNSTFSKKNIRSKKQVSVEESRADEKTGISEKLNEDESTPRETGIDILERLTDNLSKIVREKRVAEIEKLEDPNFKSMEDPLLSANSSGGEQHPELTGSRKGRNNSNSEAETAFRNDTNCQDIEQSCTLLLTPPRSSGQDGENSNYNDISSHQNEPFVESNNVLEGNNSVNDNPVEFASTGTEDQSREQADGRNSFWSDIRDSSNNLDQPAQDPLMTSENHVPNNETINANFLHNFLNEQPTTSNSSIPAENPEFVSLDRLAQTQQKQPSYDLNSNDSSTPMEQLSQQVQRIPNPTPQINVISQHHMQAPQTSQLHTSVPLSPQHISPQQPNSYDALSHMQPPMPPPPLYQGFNMYNQNYQPQATQQLPRPPLLQRPQIQARSFQSLAASPAIRPPLSKRSVLRLAYGNEIRPPKQSRRMDPPLQARPQLPNPTAKLPSGITITPPKKSVEANKVANVLASRGITVTPAGNRLSNQPPQRSQQRPSGQSPVLNIGSGVSITSTSQNRSSGSFAVPASRHTTPIVNHHVERPERCTTVDLTQDDDPPRASKGKLGRYPCKPCGKMFTCLTSLESHNATHRALAALPFKCDKCSAQYTTSTNLQKHKATFHKTQQAAPDLAIPIVDLNHPGARENLLKCGISNFIPLTQLQSNNNGYFGVPIVQLDMSREKAVSSLTSLGAGNIFVLGKMKALVPQSH